MQYNEQVFYRIATVLVIFLCFSRRKIAYSYFLNKLDLKKFVFYSKMRNDKVLLSKPQAKEYFI